MLWSITKIHPYPARGQLCYTFDSMARSLKSTVRKIFQVATRQATADTIEIEKIDGELTPNMRAIRLATSMADTMVSMGLPVAEVASLALDVTDRYCHHKVQFDISSTLITASQDRGDDYEPLTMVYPSQLRSANYLMVRDIQTLAQDIRDSKISLGYAEERFDKIIKNPLEYPKWLIIVGSAVLSSGVGIMFGAQPITVGIMFFMGITSAIMINQLYKFHIATFYVQILAAFLVTSVAILVAWCKRSLGLDILTEVHPTYIVIGGIVLLVAGLAIVGAVQDAIDEFYVTANARLLKVMLVTSGIVIGVSIALYIARSIGITITADSASLGLGIWPLPAIGAATIALGYAITVQANIKGLVLSAALGSVTWVTFSSVLGTGPLASVVASGIAATIIATMATLISRISRTPSVALVMAGIVPLTPGMGLYNALSTLISATDDDQMFAEGALMLFKVILVALAIAAGASLGHLIGRPLRRTVVQARNSLPDPRLSSESK